jgi:hypothetical protein
MEALGRVLAVTLSAVGVVVLFLFYRTASVRWQKTETVRSLCYTYVADALEDRAVVGADWERFQQELSRLGSYRTELSVFERRRYEGENGRIYMFTEWENIAENVLPEGSYIRLVVTEESGTLSSFLYGAGGTILAGGRVG